MTAPTSEESGVVLGWISECQGCDADTLEPVLHFLPQPPVQAFLTVEELQRPETAYPLDVVRCTRCGLVQLAYVPPPEVVFPRAYPYQTGMTRILRENFRELAASAVRRLSMPKGSLVIDIGSNDGTLLQGFQDEGMRVLGIEPTNIASVANGRGIPTLQEFFSEGTAARIVSEYGPAALVTATNVLAHVNNLFPMLRGISKTLHDGAMFVSESHYVFDLLERLQYDTIYHEHLRFYSVRSLRAILERAGFTVEDVQRVPTHGGSIRVWARQGSGRPSAAIDEMIAMEDAQGLSTASVFQRFHDQMLAAKLELLRSLVDRRRAGKRIVGVGAPARSSMLLAYNRLEPDLVEKIVEPAGSLKVGLWTPGTRIPIVDEATIYDDPPDDLLMLSWHIADELVPKIRSNGYRGGFIVPLPFPRSIPPTTS